MGQYKLWFSFHYILGIGFKKDDDSIEIILPFLHIIIGLMDDAKGIYLFGKTL